jgi:kynurenine formamidase
MRLDDLLAPAQLVDLTQPLGPETVLWPGSAAFAVERESDYDADGAYARTLRLPEHSGTHLDAPAHFVRGAVTVEQIPVASLVRPAVVIDARGLSGGDPRFVLRASDVEADEERHGRIETGAAVLVCFGWDAHVADAARYVGAADELAFPGLAEDAARLLVDRGVAGVGVDTISVDAGDAGDHPAHHVLLGAGAWQLEGLVALHRLPPRGAWLVAAALPVVDGSGSPARAFAVLPAAPARPDEMAT